MTNPRTPLRRRAGRIASAALATAALILATLLPVPAQAAWPEKPVRLVVPYPPGGTPDILARLLSTEVGKALGQSLVVENRPGAGGTIGGQAVARSDADGYTILMCAFGCPLVQWLYRPVPFDVVRDFDPVAMIGTVPSVLVVHPSLPVKTLPEFLAHAKAHPGKLTSASSGTGTSAHLGTLLLKTQAGIDLVHVPYKGSGQVASDLLGGQVDLYFDNLPASLASIRAGKLRALGVASRSRSPAIPDVPTFAEAGLPDFLITPWFGIMAPKGTPPEVIRRLNQVFDDAMKDPAIRSRMDQAGVVVAGGTPEDLGRFIAGEIRQWGEVVEKNGIRPE